MSSAEPGLAVGLAGCGRIAATYLEALAAVPDLRLVAAADVRKEAATAALESSDRHAAAAYDDPHRMIESEALDAVIICTPPNTHGEIAGAGLDAGIHVLCEKPLVAAPAEAEKLVAKAERAGLVLMMASKFRYVRDLLEAKAILDAGALGEIILYENVFCDKVDMRDRWNSRREVSGGGVLIDNGTHSVDIARFLLGEITQVQAEEGQRLQGLEVEDTCRLYLRTASGAMGAVDLSWSIHKERDVYVEVFGSEGALQVGWAGSRYRRGGDDWVAFGGGYDKTAAFARQLKNFADSIRGRAKPLITAEDSLESVRVIAAAYRSLEMDNWVPVAPEAAAAPGGARR